MKIDSIIQFMDFKNKELWFFSVTSTLNYNMVASEKAIVQSRVDKLICVKCKGEIGIQNALRTIHTQNDDKVNNSIHDLQRDLIELDQLAEVRKGDYINGNGYYFS
jgi:hypothetical protein